MYKKLLLTSFTLLGLINPCYAEIKDRVIEVKSGKILLQNLNAKKGVMGVYGQDSTLEISGEIVNNTNKTYLVLNLEFNFFDKDNNPITPSYKNISILNFKPGERQFISQKFFNFDKNAFNIASFNFKPVLEEYSPIYDISLIKPKLNKDLQFSDDNINIAFQLNKETISFTLLNQTENPIDLDWNKVSYIDRESNSSKIIHNGIKYIDKEKSMTETTIPPMSKLNDIIIPTNSISYSSSLNDWTLKNLLPGGYTAAATIKDKTFSVFMPIKINNAIKNYLFTFKIDNVTN
jgi:hypothetical protein